MDDLRNSFVQSSSAKDEHDNVFSDGSQIDERAMRRQLMDIESSFIPDLSPSTAKYPRGHAAAAHSFNSRMSSTLSRARDGSPSSPSMPRGTVTLQPSPSLRARAINAPRSAQAGSGETTYGNSSSRAEQASEQDFTISSPIEEASKRHKPRPLDTSQASSDIAISSGGKGDAQQLDLDEQVTQDVGETAKGGHITGEEEPVSVTTRENRVSKGSTTSSIQGFELTSNSSHPISGKIHDRPSWSKAHQPSQRYSQESGSSLVSHNTAGLDYALESGGATPATRSTLRASKDLSRIPSLGSVASSIGTNDSVHRRQKAQTQAVQALNGEITLDSLAEEKLSPVTPRANRSLGTNPTDTVLNQHVQNIQVPNTVAKNYRAAHGADDRPSTATATATPFFGRAKGDLTLKEQNSRIDKLSKENFDLKLKIHYLYQALQDRSDEGVKDLVSKNAQLQTDLIKARKEAQSLKKRLRDIDRQGTSRQGTRLDESEDDLSSKDFRQNQLEEEIVWLRERMQYLERENDKLNQEGVSREFEKRRLADQVKALGTGSAGRSDEVWKDMLDAESARRQQAEIQVRGLHQEITRLRSSRSPVRGLRRQPSKNDLTHFDSRSGNALHSSDGSGMFSGSTAIGLEQLRQENADLRRDLGAQTSMLTSRNRERERLQEEIESLKLMQRRSEGPKSTAGDSILDRSISRQNLRPNSRSGVSQQSALSESEREQLEANEAILRDENMILRMRIQDLQRDLDFVMDGAEHIDTLRAERDEAIRSGDQDRDWAANAIDEMETALEQKTSLIQQLQDELEVKVEETDTLQREIKTISDGLHRVADDCDESQSTIQDLQQSLANATGEIESLEQGIREATEAKERLEVQAESSQNEISFLREEQESDKLRISDLEAGMRTLKNWEHGQEERMRESAALEADLATSREDVLRLQKDLDLRQEELTLAKEQLADFERKLRSSLSNHSGSRADLFAIVVRLKGDLDAAVNKNHEHSRLLLDREKTILAHSQEARRLAELLDHEHQARKEDARAHARAEWSLRNGREPGLTAVEDKALDQQSLQKLSKRNALLISSWQRLAQLCGPKWAEHHQIQPPTIQAVSTSLSSIEQPLELALEAIEKTFASFRNRVRNTEHDIHRDFSALESALNSRARRIDALEKAASRGALAGGSISASELQRMKDENQNLSREIHRLRQQQQSSAFPGLVGGMASLPNSFNYDGATGDAPSGDVATAAARTAIAQDSERSAAVSPTFDGIQADVLRRRSQVNSPLPTSPESQRRSISALIPHQRLPSGSIDNGTSLSTTATTSTNAAGELVNPDISSSDQRWILRIREADMRLQKEREGRLLDRNGARRRLEEGRAEIEELRKEVERLKTAQK